MVAITVVCRRSGRGEVLGVPANVPKLAVVLTEFCRLRGNVLVVKIVGGMVSTSDKLWLSSVLVLSAFLSEL